MPYQTIIAANTLAEQRDNPDWVILDCRTSLLDKAAGLNAYHAGHIPNAIHCNLDEDFSSPITPSSGRHPLPNMPQLMQKLGNWGIHPQSQVVVYDDANGAFAARMWWQLRALGHQSVALLDGGLNYWQAQDYPLSQAVSQTTATHFECTFDNSQVITTEQVAANIQQPQFTLLDARAAARYRGEVEPLDPVAGHIPGALNRDFTLNLDENGLFLPPETLKKSFQALIDSAPNGQIVHSCGSGVTACHNLLAMEVAGLSGAKLYVGSWSEWIADESRPIAKG